jgi:hypothetical protein
MSVDPVQMIDVVRNMGTTGTETSAGRAVTGVARDILDTTHAMWHSESGDGTIIHFWFDAKDPKRFYVYPKATTSPVTYVEIIVSRAPSNTLSDSATTLGVNDIDAELSGIYEAALVDYVLYRAYSKDSQHTANANRSQWHYEAFKSAIGVKTANEIGLRPQVKFDVTQKTQPE